MIIFIINKKYYIRQNKYLLMKKYLLSLLLLLPILSIAQSNYKPGYVINLKGDTLRGYINYREWGQNPKSIDFKSDLNTKAQLMGIADIKGFEITGFEVYQKYVVKASMDIADLPHASTTGADTTTKTGAAFLRVLQTGKNITLYSYDDDIKNRFYVKDNNMAVPLELIYKVYFEKDDSRNLITKTTYKGQLIAIASALNLNGVQAQIERTDYNTADLSKIISKINEDSKKSLKDASLNKTSSVRFFIGAGLNSSTLNYEGDSPFPNSQGAVYLYSHN
jgi:hypothetical protein